MKSPAQALLRDATGLNLSKATAERAVRLRMEQQACSDSGQYLATLTPDELGALIELVVVPESWLFRDPGAFGAAAEFVARRWAGAARPDAARPSAARPDTDRAVAPRRPIQILSIPCAGGEEPYSMAMALRDAGVPDAAFCIDAIDLSQVCIARARAGVYGRNAFRSADLSFRARYFTRIGDDAYRIIDGVRTRINFRQGNLLEWERAACAGYYDVVFCRNLLIYFDQPTTKAAIATLGALLADDGMLLVGYAEVPTFCRYGYAPLALPQAFALGKRAAATPAPTIAPSKALPPPAWKTAPPRPAPQKTAAVAAMPPVLAATDSLLLQAQRLANLGRFAEAGAQCRAHLAVAPDAADAYFLLGILAEREHDPRLAEHCWRRCIYLQAQHYEALCHLALLLAKNGDQAGAAALKARAARIFQRRAAAP
ncbi:chemotaxis protein methyltransferase WspC [Oxalobacteraceae bacterium GrIS 1.11]